MQKISLMQSKKFTNEALDYILHMSGINLAQLSVIWGDYGLLRVLPAQLGVNTDRIIVSHFCLFNTINFNKFWSLFQFL